MTHMLGAIKSAAMLVMNKIRRNYNDKSKLKELSELFWGDFATESQRFLATIRDSQKEEMQATREKSKGSGANMAENINMPGMKLSGNILGTSGVSQSQLEQNQNAGSYMQRGMVQGGAGGD